LHAIQVGICLEPGQSTDSCSHREAALV
jgi:hypothetical protein